MLLPRQDLIRNPPSSPSQIAGIIGRNHRTQPLYFVFETRICYLCLGWLGTQNPLVFATQVAGIIGIIYYIQLIMFCFSFSVFLLSVESDIDFLFMVEKYIFLLKLKL
jgi:hypothetical protein